MVMNADLTYTASKLKFRSWIWIWYTHDETYKPSTACIGKHLSDLFLIQNDMIRGDASSPLLSNVALECAIRKVQDNKEELKLNRTRQFLVFADNVIYYVKT
jgi:hypothetical protein